MSTPILISWSGEPSKILAQSLRELLPVIDNRLKPWMSERDISEGSRWTNELFAQLDSVSCGIFCLTTDNRNAPWINFEAGALARRGDSTIIPLLIGMGPGEIQGPLAQFMASTLTKKSLNRIVDILRSVADDGGRSVEDSERVQRAVEMVWPKLSDRYELAVKATQDPTTEPSGEVLVPRIMRLVQQVDLRLSDIEFAALEALGRKEHDPETVGSHSQWQRHQETLGELRGDWVQYIPERESESRQFSILNFDTNQVGHYRFAGTNYRMDGTTDYSFESIKMLPPVRHDNDTLLFYSVYLRKDRTFLKKYGFAKMVARRKGTSPTSFEFDDGFFFNEDSRDESNDGFYSTSMIRMSAIDGYSDSCDTGWQHPETGKVVRRDLFALLMKGRDAGRWSFEQMFREAAGR